METQEKINPSFDDQLITLQDNIMAIAFSLTSDKEKAKNLLQRTVLRMLDNNKKFFNDNNLKKRVFTFPDNNFDYEIKYTNREITRTGSPYHRNVCQNQESGINAKNFTAEEIERIINLFPDEYRLPFLLYSSGFSYEKIVSLLCLPMSMIKSRIFFIQKRIQELLCN